MLETVPDFVAPTLSSPDHRSAACYQVHDKASLEAPGVVSCKGVLVVTAVLCRGASWHESPQHILREAYDKKCEQSELRERQEESRVTACGDFNVVE